MALPFTITVTCVAVGAWPGEDVGDGSSEYAYVAFELADAEASDDEVLDHIGGGTGRIVFRITQAQRDDFTEGNDYEISMSAA